MQKVRQYIADAADKADKLFEVHVNNGYSIELYGHVYAKSIKEARSKLQKTKDWRFNDPKGFKVRIAVDQTYRPRTVF